MTTHMARCGRRVMLALAVGLLLLVTACAGAATSPVQEMSSADGALSRAEFAPAAGAEDAANAVPIDARKVVATAHLELVVEDVQDASDRIAALVAQAGGYISQTNLYRNSYGGQNLLQGTITLRVPAENLEAALAELESAALEVRSKSIDREDVTDQYSDIEAQLRNLEATENELRELLAEVRARPNATSEDILAVHRDLTEIRGEIEQLQGRKNMLDNLIGLSTITVTLIPDAASRPVLEAQWRPRTVVRDATRALVSALQFFGDVAIWIVVFLLPILLLAFVPLLIIGWLIRAILVRRKRRRGTA